MERVSRTARIAALFVLLLAAATGLPAQATDAANPANPFAGFDSFRLGNGLKVWYGVLPGATVTSMAVVAPAGFDADPPGREQTAHLLEHVLLSDRAGSAEAELVRDLAAHGGTYNGATHPDRTYYWVNIGTADAAYGLRWLYDVIAPREFGEAVVQRNREPVAIEIGARPRHLGDWVNAWFITQPRLRPASFWLREFGLETSHDLPVDEFAALNAIRARDLRTFYDTYYAPTEMTLVIVSGAPRALLQRHLEETFGTLPWRPAGAERPRIQPRNDEARRFAWHFGRNTTLRLYHRIPELNGQNQLRLTLIARLLEKRLMERLRRGTAKAIYSIQVDVTMRGPANALLIAAVLNPREERTVRAAIDEEIVRISDASRDASFYDDRDAIAREIFTRYASPEALRSIAVDRFYRPDLHAEFPDLGEYVRTAGPDSIGAFAARTLTAEQRILRLSRPLPLSPAGLIAIGIVLVWLAGRAYRALVFRPADMNGIRYVARLRHPARLLRGALLVLLALVTVRLVLAAAHGIAEYWIATMDSFLLHALAASALLFALAFTGLAAIGLIPYKVLVFERELRLKSRTYRAVTIPGNELRGARLDGAATGAKGPVHIELAGGGSLRLHVRHAPALLGALAALQVRCATPVAPPVSDVTLVRTS